MTPTSSPWVNLQISFALAGGAVWFAGALFERDFVSGIGVGLVAAALLLRVGRRGEGGASSAREQGPSGAAGPSAGVESRSTGDA